MKLKGIKDINGVIILKSGLHIGAGDMEMHIGGTDNQVIKHPHTQKPFIPGSSLKGKVRSLLEMRSGLVGMSDGKPVSATELSKLQTQGKDAGECMNILKLFGCGGAESEEKSKIGPTRLSFADCALNTAWTEKAEELNYAFTEVKSENSINRISGTAQNPRFTERVPSGAEFDFSITMKVFEEDDEEDLTAYLLKGLKLLELDALGGSGSRGYGRVAFTFNDPAVQEQFNSIDPM